MKKILFITFVCLLATSCAAPAPRQTPPAPAEPLPEVQLPPVFQLKALPELPPYDAPGEIMSRYYTEPWVSELRPAEDYGMLYPYLGKVAGDDWFNEYRYGLADSLGRIVVDPVYRRAEYIFDEAGEPLALFLAYHERFVLASVDGSRINADIRAQAAQIVGQKLCVFNYSELYMDFIAVQPGQTYRFYDTQGRVLEEGEGDPSIWPDSEAEAEETPPDFDIPGINISYPVGNGWWAALYSHEGETGLALTNGESEHRFDYQGFMGMNCSYLWDDTLIIRYEGPSQPNRTVIFDAARGQVLKTMENYGFDQALNDSLLVLYPYGNYKPRLVLNHDFEPAFAERDIRYIEHAAGDIYSVRTSLMSGLIRENGEWLLRVYINNLD